jgi:hypothetical protein
MSQGGADSGARWDGLVAALAAFRSGPLERDPSDRALARAARVSPDTIGHWLAGDRFPHEEGKFLVVVRTVARRAAARGVVPRGGAAGLLDEDCWRQAYRAENERRARVVSAGVQRGRAARALAGLSAGRPLEEVTDPFALEVHRPVQSDDAPSGLPVLPPYMLREHDQMLGQVVRAAADGRSGIAVLVGGSSTGKTRACWEALDLLRDQNPPWRLWHPIDPTRPDAALRELPEIGPRTAVWLNEAQFYLDPAEAGLGERVAAGLRELLRDPGRAPVLVLATMWPGFWDTLTARPPEDAPDPHAQARELLAGHDIPVPAAFTPAQMGQLARTADARMELAAQSAPDGEVIQFLAGAPELLTRYRNAPPPAAALIDAAMDARRLGIGAGLPQAFLEAAAPGYLTDDQWDALGEDWLEQALAYTAVPCKGARGPLTRIRPRPVRRAARHHGDPPGSTAAAAGPLYRLADYLDQHGRAHRASQIPPAEFWSAAAAYTMPDEQAALGDAADARGLYRAAAQLHKNAAASGNLSAAFYLSSPPDCLSADPRLAHWAAAHVSLDDPDGLADLLDSLLGTGADEQAAALLARDPASHVSLDDPDGLADLLRSLRRTGAHEQAAALAGRAAAHAPLDDPDAIARLLASLRQAGAREQAAALAGRAAAHAPLDDPVAVVRLLASMRQAGARDQADALARRAAAHVSPDDPQRQAGALAQRAADVLDDPHDVASLQEMGAWEQADALARRAADVLHDPYDVADLLSSLRRTGADEQAAPLAGRAAAQVALDDPYAIASLLASLRVMGAQEQTDTLLARDPATHVSLDEPVAVVSLLDELWAIGAREQADALADRLPGAGMFELFREQGNHQDRFRFGREGDGTPAAPWGWEDLDLWPVPQYGPRRRNRDGGVVAALLELARQDDGEVGLESLQFSEHGLQPRRDLASPLGRPALIHDHDLHYGTGELRALGG